MVHPYLCKHPRINCLQNKCIERIFFMTFDCTFHQRFSRLQVSDNQYSFSLHVRKLATAFSTCSWLLRTLLLKLCCWLPFTYTLMSTRSKDWVKTEKTKVSEWIYGKKLACKLWRYVSIRRKISEHILKWIDELCSNFIFKREKVNLLDFLRYCQIFSSGP